VNYEEKLGLVGTATAVATGIYYGLKGLKEIVTSIQDLKARRILAEHEKEMAEIDRQIAELERQAEAYGVAISQLDSLTDEMIARYEAKKAEHDKQKKELLTFGAIALIGGFLMTR